MINEVVLEGLIRGVNIERALVTVVSKDQKTLMCKSALGEGTESLSWDFSIDI